jgi:hypothetical protein
MSDLQSLRPAIEQATGVMIMFLVLLDIFLTVLYVRMGTSFLVKRLARLTWRGFLLIAKLSPSRRPAILSFAGPSMLLVFVVFWGMALLFGSGLIVHPKLGTAVRASSGPTPTDFITAMYVGGSSMSIVGASNFEPQTKGFRMLFLLGAIVGVSTVSLTLTYLMQVYSALLTRNALGLSLYLLSAESGDAAKAVAALGPDGQFSAGYSNLVNLAGEMTELKEVHHFYPVLFYFRFRESYYSVSMSTFIALEVVTLIRSALDDGSYGWLKRSAAVEQIWRASFLLVKALETTFVPGGSAGERERPRNATVRLWRERYFAALPLLHQAGIETVADEHRGADLYVSLREQWDLHIQRMAPYLAYEMADVDRVTSALAKQGKISRS